jgi:hypothetical protein
MNKSTITIDVMTDENRVPDSISWSATDTSADNAQKAKAMMISFWDGAEKAALRIDHDDDGRYLWPCHQVRRSGRRDEKVFQRIL